MKARSSSKGSAKLTGTNVTLIFDKTSKLKAEGSSKLNLTAPTSGSMAGMLLIAPQDNAKTFALESAAVDRLEGVIYMPGAELVVQGGRINEASKWTISITKSLTVKLGAELVIASDYAGSTIPVPASVKSSNDAVRLVSGEAPTAPAQPL